MHALITALAIATSVPAPSQAILTAPGPTEWTRRLLAQNEVRDAELEAIERDMERSRQRLGHPKTKSAEPAVCRDFKRATECS